MLIHADPDQAVRQVHMIDGAGQIAAHTGAGCNGWAGQGEGEAVSVAGNMLVGSAVVEDASETYSANMGLLFVERLMLAMDAGEAAGGDRRGRQSAALIVQGPEPYHRLDMRVDDHTEPLAELRRLYGAARRQAEGGRESVTAFME